MRLWHKDLLSVLPNKWLVAQWRELSAISGRLKLTGSPQHALVNKLTQYEWQHFAEYVYRVYQELINRGVYVQQKVYDKIISKSKNAFDNFDHQLIAYTSPDDLFATWHNNKYLIQCYYNLQEKYDCGILTQSEFDKIKQRVSFIVGGLCII